MKTTMDYMIGNTAVQIVKKGNRIRIIDVQKRELRKVWLQRILVGLIMAVLMFGSCSYVVRMNNQQAFLKESVCSLKDQVSELRIENTALERASEDYKVNYSDILNKAKSLGMKFPNNKQVYKYKVNKSTMVRMNNVSTIVE